MKKGQIIQAGIIALGIFIGIHFSKRNFALHQKEEHGFSIVQHNMNHGLLDISQDSIIPAITELILTKDSMSGWNLFIQTSNFQFTPEKVNQRHQSGTGHAHLYINGQKYARVYSPYFHLPDLIGVKNELKIVKNLPCGYKCTAKKRTSAEVAKERFDNALDNFQKKRKSVQQQNEESDDEEVSQRSQDELKIERLRKRISKFNQKKARTSIVAGG